MVAPTGGGKTLAGILPILPTFGTYTGGLDCATPPLSGLMPPGARAVLIG